MKIVNQISTKIDPSLESEIVANLLLMSDSRSPSYKKAKEIGF